MNFVDLFNAPDGFPLEADATLGFMQTDYQSAINGLAQANNSHNFIIVSGCDISGNDVGDGWLMIDGELVRFIGGERSTYIVLDETVVQKANQNGQLYDRYITKVWRFGENTTPSFNIPRNQIVFDLFVRLTSVVEVMKSIQFLADEKLTIPTLWVVLVGLEPNDAGTEIESGVALYNNQIVVADNYEFGIGSEANPIYLKPDGTWTTTSDATYLALTPRTSRRFSHILRKRTTMEGQIFWKLTSSILTDSFDATGLGKYEWEGFAKANGQNGTTDLSNAIAGLTAIQRI